MPYFCLHLSVPSLRLGDERAPSRAGAAHRFGGWSRRFASRCRTPCAVKTKGSSFHLAVLGRATTEGKVKKIRQKETLWVMEKDIPDGFFAVIVNVGVFFLHAETCLDLR